jgi:K+-sensing histidine kinase KdpD
MVHAQPRRLSQALGHLLFAAVTFTPSGGRITVRVENPHSPTMELHDIGAHGGPTQLYEHVLNSTIHRHLQDAQPGADAGLAAVNAIFDLHHATVALHDSAAEGTDMHVVFPPAK